METQSNILKATVMIKDFVNRPLDSADSGSLKHVKANHSVIIHNNRMIRLNEPHTTHISSQIKHMIDVFRHFQTIIHHTKINKMKLVTKHVFRHVLVFLPVRSNNVMPLGFQTSSNV
ncbi:hypothetical protein HanIR_Chr03g0148431 [Helianthus annuus]|nr:hypothetical protein HanIR_Chr03g0148431 [Helianthus annuus]